MKNLRSVFIIVAASFIFHIGATAQSKIIKGFVKDGHSDELLPFASVTFKNTAVGKATDSSGHFIFSLINGHPIL